MFLERQRSLAGLPVRIEFTVSMVPEYGSEALSEERLRST